MAHLKEKRIQLPYAGSAGDEFQTVASDLPHIPGLFFDLRRRMMQLRIGSLSGYLRPPVNQLSGQAFAFGRIAIQEAKKRRAHSGSHTRFHSQSEEFDLIANLVYSLHDALVGNLSEKQWETVDAYLAQGHVDLAARA